MAKERKKEKERDTCTLFEWVRTIMPFKSLLDIRRSYKFFLSIAIQSDFVLRGKMIFSRSTSFIFYAVVYFIFCAASFRFAHIRSINLIIDTEQFIYYLKLKKLNYINENIFSTC